MKITEYTIFHILSEKKSEKVRSGNRDGHETGTPLPIERLPSS